jgi:hypothetical protein
LAQECEGRLRRLWKRFVSVILRSSHGTLNLILKVDAVEGSVIMEEIMQQAREAAKGAAVEGFIQEAQKR